MSAIKTAQDFVRALKAPNDPPSAVLPRKVQIAREGWDDQAFHVPNKAELIVDWLLGRFQKERNQQSVILDVEAWRLLHDVCAGTPKSALVPVLGRANTASVLQSTLKALCDCSSETRTSVLAILRPTLSAIWPIVSAKLSYEALLDLFGHTLRTTSVAASEDVDAILAQISATFTASLVHASNKKKVYTTFLDTYLADWLQRVVPLHDADTNVAFTAGIDILFNSDILKQATADSEPAAPLFAALAKQSRDLVLMALPALFSAFTSAVNDNRHAIFSQASNAPASATAEKVRAVSIGFYVACEGLLKDANDVALAWHTRKALLAIVEKERLLTPDTEPVLHQIADAAILAVSNRRGGAWTDDVVEVLSTICRIDYELLGPYVGRLLPLLVTLPALPATATLLTILLNYYSKTRTLDAYVDALATAILGADLTDSTSTETYRACYSSPIFQAAHLDRLADAISSFLTPSQIVPQVEAAVARLNSLWEEYHSTATERKEPASPDSPRKRRKVEAPASSEKAIRLSLLCALLSVVVTAVPTRLLSADQQEESRIHVESLRSLLNAIIKKTSKEIRKGEGAVRRGAEIILTAALRFVYASAVVQTDGQDETVADEGPLKVKVATDLLSIAGDARTQAELVLEIFRILLLSISLGSPIDANSVHESILTYLDARLSSSVASWDGHYHHLDSSNAHLAVLHVLLQRWIHVVDSTASTQQLERFAAMLMSMDLDVKGADNGSGITAQSLVLQAMRSAQFWEMGKLRPAIFAYLSSTLSSNTDQAAITRCFHKLLYFPTDYLTRAFRTEAISTAVQMDVAICEGRTAGDGDTRTRDLTITRVFLGRTFASLGSIDLPLDTLTDHLYKLFTARVSCEDSTYADASLDLVEVYLSTLLKSTDAVAATGCAKVVQALGKFRAADPTRDLLGLALIRAVDVLKRGFTPMSVHKDVQEGLQLLFNKLQSLLQKHVTEAIKSVPESASIRVMAVWTSVISLGKWLEVNLPEQTMIFAQPLTRKVASLSSDSADWTLAASASLSLMWVELSCVSSEGKRERLDIAFASYVLYVSKSAESGVAELDHCISAAVKTLSPEDYGYVLELLIEALRGKQPGLPLTLPLLHAARVLLNNYPQNSLKHTQTFASECISIFNNYAAYISGGSDVIVEVLRFVASYCTDRPAALRQSDLPLIFALLSNYLRPIRPIRSQAPTTSTAVFHAITTITGALIRLRRDLLSATLPHLSLVLRQLLFALRRPRPQLGRRQLDALAKTFPSWIDPRNPLGAEEAAALARVLEALTTKTIPRTHKSGGAASAGDASAAKATSLAPVFSRHAAPVLAAYADAANDPLCITPAEVRKALQPGLFALCGMLNEHTRDAMMVASLDAAGKVTMKSLWREFERQRYVGKG